MSTTDQASAFPSGQKYLLTQVKSALDHYSASRENIGTDEAAHRCIAYLIFLLKHEPETQKQEKITHAIND